MKRKERILKNSLFTSQIKLNRGDDNMNITATKVFKVGNKEYSSREEAIVASAMDILHSEIPLGIDNVIAKSGDIIKALQVVGKKK